VLPARNSRSVNLFVTENAPGGTFWVGGGVLTDAEVSALRARGYAVTVFANRLTTVEDIEDAVATVEEHHPNDPVLADAFPR